MASTSSLPVSSLLKNKEPDETEGEANKKQSREEWRKAKELEEARKAGTAPAAVDEEGRDINPHIPQYISSAPWYFGSQGPTLKHQRPQPEHDGSFTRLTDYYERGQKGQKAAKFRKGACDNCGAMGHTKKDCVERPRKVGAKFSGSVIAADDVVLPEFNLGFDGKRDRWNGYDPSQYQAVVDEHKKLEDYKRQIKTQQLKAGHDVNEEDDDDDDDDDDDEDKYADNVDMPGTKVDSKQRITVRNLRIREDTAKYLQNLDINSAHYDPKTRSMRDNPYKNTGKRDDEVHFAGENFVRFTGDTVQHAKLQMFAWEANEKGVDVSVMAEPTKVEMLKKEYEKSKDTFKEKISNKLLDRYGGKEHLDAPPRELLLAQTENYVEYSRHGKIIKGAEKEVIRSIYPEDVFLNNHTSVWGSYWRDGQWGFECCHAFVKNSYCTGEKGKSVEGDTLLDQPSTSNANPFEATPGNQSISQGLSNSGPSTLTINQSIQGLSKEPENSPEEQVPEEDLEQKEPETLMEIHQKKLHKKSKKSKKKKHKKEKKHKKKKRRKEESSESSSSDSSDEDEEETRRRKLRAALIRAQLEDAKSEEQKDDRKRKYNSMFDAKAPTEVEVEAFHLRRTREEDPMASFM